MVKPTVTMRDDAGRRLIEYFAVVEQRKDPTTPSLRSTHSSSQQKLSINEQTQQHHPVYKNTSSNGAHYQSSSSSSASSKRLERAGSIDSTGSNTTAVSSAIGRWHLSQRFPSLLDEKALCCFPFPKELLLKYVHALVVDVASVGPQCFNFSFVEPATFSQVYCTCLVVDPANPLLQAVCVLSVDPASYGYTQTLLQSLVDVVSLPVNPIHVPVLVSSFLYDLPSVHELKKNVDASLELVWEIPGTGENGQDSSNQDCLVGINNPDSPPREQPRRPGSAQYLPGHPYTTSTSSNSMFDPRHVPTAATGEPSHHSNSMHELRSALPRPMSLSMGQPLSGKLQQTLSIPLVNPRISYLPEADEQALSTMLTLFQPDTIVQVVEHLLLEHSVVMVASDSSLARMVCESFRALIFPFAWQGVYMVALPEVQFPALVASGETFMVSVVSHRADHVEMCLQSITETSTSIGQGVSDYLFVDVNRGVAKSIAVDRSSNLRRSSSQPSGLQQKPSTSSLLSLPTAVPGSVGAAQDAQLQPQQQPTRNPKQIPGPLRQRLVASLTQLVVEFRKNNLHGGLRRDAAMDEDRGSSNLLSRPVSPVPSHAVPPHKPANGPASSSSGNSAASSSRSFHASGNSSFMSTASLRSNATSASSLQSTVGQHTSLLNRLRVLFVEVFLSCFYSYKNHVMVWGQQSRNKAQGARAAPSPAPGYDPTTGTLAPSAGFDARAFLNSLPDSFTGENSLLADFVHDSKMFRQFVFHSASGLHQDFDALSTVWKQSHAAPVKGKRSPLEGRVRKILDTLGYSTRAANAVTSRLLQLDKKDIAEMFRSTRNFEAVLTELNIPKEFEEDHPEKDAVRNSRTSKLLKLIQRGTAQASLSPPIIVRVTLDMGARSSVMSPVVTFPSLVPEAMKPPASLVVAPRVRFHELSFLAQLVSARITSLVLEEELIAESLLHDNTKNRDRQLFALGHDKSLCFLDSLFYGVDQGDGEDGHGGSNLCSPTSMSSSTTAGSPSPIDKRHDELSDSESPFERAFQWYDAGLKVQQDQLAKQCMATLGKSFQKLRGCLRTERKRNQRLRESCKKKDMMLFHRSYFNDTTSPNPAMDVLVEEEGRPIRHAMSMNGDLHSLSKEELIMLLQRSEREKERLSTKVERYRISRRNSSNDALHRSTSDVMLGGAQPATSSIDAIVSKKTDFMPRLVRRQSPLYVGPTRDESDRTGLTYVDGSSGSAIPGMSNQDEDHHQKPTRHSHQSHGIHRSQSDVSRASARASIRSHRPPTKMLHSAQSTDSLGGKSNGSSVSNHSLRSHSSYRMMKKPAPLDATMKAVVNV